MSTIHTVTLPDNTTARRTSANRVYPFVIALEPPVTARLLEAAEADLVRLRKHNSQMIAVAEYLEAGGSVHLGEPNALGWANVYLTDAAHLQSSDRGIGWISDGKFQGRTVEGTLQEQAAAWFRSVVSSDEHLAARVDQLKAAPERFGDWEAVTWCSRADLATKAAAQYGTADRRAVILDTTMVTK